MTFTNNSPLVRIGIFYDGSFFMRLSQFFGQVHNRRSYIDIDGFHRFLGDRIARVETDDEPELCKIVDAHFFRGRFSLESAKKANALESDRFIDQILMYSGVVTHYFPMNENAFPPEEKGVDLWLALEVFEQAASGTFDVVVLVAGDQNYVPLLRKCNKMGVRVMIVGTDVEYEDHNGVRRFLRTSPRLIDEAPYNIDLTKAVDEAGDDPFVERLFRK
jgi:uncharacterized LabA/DUF88 family protein